MSIWEGNLTYYIAWKWWKLSGMEVLWPTQLLQYMMHAILFGAVFRKSLSSIQVGTKPSGT